MEDKPEGYVYAADEAGGVMSAARAGARVEVAGRRPPFIVVDARIESIVVARWPGRLWRVRIADPVTAADERATGLVRPLASAGYSRAVAVQVISEIPAWKLFGDWGEAVCAVIAVAGELDTDRVRALARHRDAAAGEAYSRAWNTWLKSMNEPARSDNLAGAIGVFSRGPGRSRSPIHCGFSVVHRSVCDRAQAVVGDAAFVHEADETYLEPTWSTAANTLLEAAMAFGAGLVLRDQDRRIMSAAWHRVVGASPPRSLA